MDITPPISQSRQLIQRYGAGSFTIAGKEYHGSVLVLPERTEEWKVTDVDTINETTLAPLLEGAEIEVLLIGSGEKQEFFSPELRQKLRGRGIVVECMDTGAACRTFNILMSEDRKVAAALIVV